MVNHYESAVVVNASSCPKTELLAPKGKGLVEVVHAKSLTTPFTPNNVRDVSGPQVVSCTTFMDYTHDFTAGNYAKFMQVMWVHIEEPESNQSVVEPYQGIIRYVTHMRDMSGSTTVGIPERIALKVASCTSVAQTQKAA